VFSNTTHIIAASIKLQQTISYNIAISIELQELYATAVSQPRKTMIYSHHCCVESENFQRYTKEKHCVLIV
jgi:hypothetical protein